MKKVQGNVFSLVCPSFCPSGGGGSHVIITHNHYPCYIEPQCIEPSTPTLTLPPWTSDMGPLWRVAITGDLFKLVHLRTPTSTTDIWWPLKYVRSASGQYASCLNAFLLFLSLLDKEISSSHYANWNIEMYEKNTL